MFWSKATQEGWPPEDSRELQKDVGKTKRSKMENGFTQADYGEAGKSSS